MNNNNILISALVSVYNSERFFRGKILDLLEQTISDNLEIIIINSGSTQNEREILKNEFSHIENIKYIETKDRETIYKAWNRGIKTAKGKYITNANCDDRLDKYALEKMSNFLEQNLATALVYSDQYFSHIPNEKFVDLRKKQGKKRSDYTRMRLLNKCIIGSQPLWRSSLHYKDNIWFDEQFEVAGDYDFACRVAEKYNIAKLDEYLGVYYVSKKRRNKEFLNMSQTISETIGIIEKYSTRYLNNATDKDLKYLKRLLVIYRFIPTKLFALIRKLNLFLFPKNELIEQYFINYLGSLFYELKGDLPKAKSLCKRHLNVPLLLKRYNRLKQ